MACTVAVEDVIEEHYGRQEEALGESQPELKATVQKFRAEEVEHKSHAIEQGAEQAAAYPLLYAAISRGTKLAIWLSERI
jgi:ubiquinone biosynthesis monooxygenase Coq7